MANHSQRMWLCLPPVVLALLDAGLTLRGQPGDYWAGDWTAARELNPFFAVLLTAHPGLFVLGLLAWIAGFCFVIRYAGPRVSFWTAFAFSLGHACGAASWLVDFGVIGWLTAVLLLVFAERLTVWSWRRAGRRALD